jgi:hypothetical protein
MTGFLRAATMIGLAAWSLTAASPRVSGPDIPKTLLPDAVRGWQADGADHVYDAETIFEYIDGAGEVYRAYNMKALLSRRYKQAGRPDIIADVFDMGSAADAFGVFTHDLDGEDPSVGQGGVYKGGLLSFWKDRYFVSVFSEEETAEAKAMLLDLGRRVAAAVGREGVKPALLDALPPAFADPKRVHFFRHPVILNYHYFIGAENVLGLDPRSEGLLVKAAGRSALVVVRYPDDIRAAAALKSVRAAFLVNAAGPEPVRAADGTWTAAGLQGRTLAVFFRAETAAAAAGAVRAVIGQIREKGL